MKKYFPFLILVSIVLIIGMNSCKKKSIIEEEVVVPPITNDLISQVSGTYQVIRRHYQSNMGGSSITPDTSALMNLVVTKSDPESIKVLNHKMFCVNYNADSTVLMFEEDYYDYHVQNAMIYFALNDSISVMFRTAYSSSSDVYYYDGKK